MMEQNTLQEYVEQIVIDVNALNKKYQASIKSDQVNEASLASLSNFIGNAKQYIHELNTAMNGGDQFLVINNANKDIDLALQSLGELWHKDVISEVEYRYINEKLSNLGLLVRSAIDPDYLQGSI